MSSQARDSQGRFKSDADGNTSDGTETQASILRRAKAALGGRLPASVNWGNFLTTREDATINGVSFMSRPREWHAAGVGFSTTLFVAATVLLDVPLPALFAVGAGAGVVATRTVRRFISSDHFADAVKEPAYAALGVVLAVGLLASSQLASAPSVRAGIRLLVGS